MDYGRSYEPAAEFFSQDTSLEQKSAGTALAVVTLADAKGVAWPVVATLE